MPKPQSETTIQEVRAGTVLELDTPTHLKLVRHIFDETIRDCNAGYLLVIFIPGTDTVLRSFHGVDTPQECVALSRDVVTMMTEHANNLAEKAANLRAQIDKHE
jgi:hypothetical protein